MNREQADIQSGNKLIAEFMGMKIGIDKYSYRPGVIMPLQEENLAFHSSWGWLHDAWDKFKFCINIDGNPVTEPYRTYSIQMNRVSNAIINLSIGEAFDRLVEAIQWYNTTNQKTISK